MQRTFAELAWKSFVLAISCCLFAGLIVIPWVAFRFVEGYFDSHESLSLAYTILAVAFAIQATKSVLRAFGDTVLAIGRWCEQRFTKTAR